MDGVDKLLPAFVGLFERVYHQIQVPAQWLISKTIPIYKNKTMNRRRLSVFANFVGYADSTECNNEANVSKILIGYYDYMWR